MAQLCVAVAKCFVHAVMRRFDCMYIYPIAGIFIKNIQIHFDLLHLNINSFILKNKLCYYYFQE